MMRHRSTTSTALAAVLAIALIGPCGALAGHQAHADSCAEAKPGSDMAADCLVQEFFDLAASGISERFDPIGYTCAAHDGDPTELLEGNDKITSRTRAFFKADKIVSLDVDLIYATSDDLSIIKGDPASLVDDSDVVIAHKQGVLLGMLKDRICPAGMLVTDRFVARLRRNRTSIRSPYTDLH